MRRVIVLSGISGSGKSVYADDIIYNIPPIRQFRDGGRWGDGCLIVSADQYFMRDGIYQFDASKLGLAHADCFRRFLKFLQQSEESQQSTSPTVVVDNTNTTVEEISPYMLAAQAFEWEAEVITLHLPVLYACERNVHGLNEKAVGNQFRRLMARKLPPWWKNTDIKQPFPRVVPRDT